LLNGYYNILVLQEYLSLLGAEDPKSNKINILNHLIIKTLSSSRIINKYMETLILALVIPSIFIIIFGIILVGIQFEPGDLAYLLLLFAFFIPAGVILLLIRNFAGYRTK
jgi:hypothetical protein